MALDVCSTNWNCFSGELTSLFRNYFIAFLLTVLMVSFILEMIAKGSLSRSKALGLDLF